MGGLRSRRKNSITSYQKSFQVSFVVGDVHGSAAENVGGPDHAGKADGAAEGLGGLVVLGSKKESLITTA